jgi:perosamine synthetase
VTVGVVLREVTAADARLLFSWRNLPEIVALGSLNRTVSWEEHERWFAGVVAERERMVRIVETDGAPVGQIRFDREGEADRNAVVSIYLLQPHKGQGLGVEALRRGCLEVFARWPIARVLAFVRAANQASLSAFAKAGFVGTSDDVAHVPEGHVALAVPRPSPVPHNRLTHDEREVAAVVAVVQSGQWSSGPRVAELERELARCAAVRGAVCVASGTAALRLSLLALGVRRGDTVAMPAYSCVALPNAALALSASPTPVDVRPDDFNLDSRGLSGLGSAPRACIAVHTFGAPADVQAMSSIAPVVEDCSHAFGLSLGGRPLGGLGKVAVISLYATKLLGAGEGGAVLSDDEALLEIVRDYRDYTDKAPNPARLNDKMTDLCAAIALCQLAKLSDLLHRRQALAQRYDQALRRAGVTSEVALLPDIERARVWYRYAVTMQTPCAQAIVDAMACRGVSSARPVDPWCIEPGDRETAYPVASHAYRSVVSLPLYPSLREEEQQRVVYAFVQACRENTAA